MGKTGIRRGAFHKCITSQLAHVPVPVLLFLGKRVDFIEFLLSSYLLLMGFRIFFYILLL